MRVYRFASFDGLDGLQVRDEPVPSPQRGELLLKVHAVSLNYRDIAIPLSHYVRDSKINLVPCSDAATEVVEVSENVDDYRASASDRVVRAFYPARLASPCQ